MPSRIRPPWEQHLRSLLHAFDLECSAGSQVETVFSLVLAAVGVVSWRPRRSTSFGKQSPSGRNGKVLHQSGEQCNSRFASPILEIRPNSWVWFRSFMAASEFSSGQWISSS
jgi:hypothetical protein